MSTAQACWGDVGATLRNHELLRRNVEAAIELDDGVQYVSNLRGRRANMCVWLMSLAVRRKRRCERVSATSGRADCLQSLRYGRLPTQNGLPTEPSSGTVEGDNAEAPRANSCATRRMAQG